MAKYLLTRKAVDDLAEIWRYTADKWSADQADKYYHLLIGTFQKIARNPETGRDYPQVTGNIRGVRAGRHLIFFQRKNNQEVLIVRILHEQMDLKTRITEG
jgi:toxin ParE1/3/4